MLTATAVKARARELGFDLCGVAAAEAFPELSYLREWLDAGYAGDMAYLARSADRRADVRRVVPGARSVVVTGTLYNVDRPYSTDIQDPATALVARYAWGDDYHDVLGGRMQALLDWMREQSPEPFEARAYVDTGPVQERVFAQYAGLGWIGKNTCLINPDLGSWLFLAEIICTLDLEPDAQGLEQCGSCTACLDACPTGALVEAGALDATRCLSYLTIELRGSMPEPLRAAIGSHVYGCDICQEVCPYNQPAPHSSDPAWQPRPGLDLPRMVDLWQTTDGGLRSLVKGSAMTRAKLPGLRRNLAVAIGNAGLGETLASTAGHPDGHDVPRPSLEDPLVRDHVEWARQRGRGV
ncbi:MAG: tRNA epoxyqueuosine(34) reductase QueG [Vicinamibacterales bacterium]